MNWKEYEKEIHEELQLKYPDATILHNVEIEGRYSKVNRQIDILIEVYAAGEKFRIIIDAKLYNKKIDVKHVETFLSMMQDVNIDKGLLITEHGYTPAAINRAYYDPSRVELDILNFKELQEFQGFLAYPYSGENGVILPCPFGWIIDAKKRKGFLATLYQRGYNLDEAGKSKEWMYVVISKKDDQYPNLQNLIARHEISLKSYEPSATFKYDRTVSRKDNAETLLRTIEADSYPTPEITGFIEFDDFIFLAVLFTPIELKEKNLKKLEYIIANVVPIKIDVDQIYKEQLEKLELEFANTTEKITQAEILISMGNVLKKMKKYQECERKYNESINIIKTSYEAIKGKIDLYLLLKKSKLELKEIIDKFFEIEPTNPTICQDLIELYSNYDLFDDLIDLFSLKIEDYKQNYEVCGNINFHLALIVEDTYKSLEYFEEAQNCFIKSLPKNHEVFTMLKKKIKELKK
jgi:tetratricopeptide (TPR) repeat protein